MWYIIIRTRAFSSNGLPLNSLFENWTPESLRTRFRVTLWHLNSSNWTCWKNTCKDQPPTDEIGCDDEMGQSFVSSRKESIVASVGVKEIQEEQWDSWIGLVRDIMKRMGQKMPICKIISKMRWGKVLETSIRSYSKNIRNIFVQN